MPKYHYSEARIHERITLRHEEFKHKWRAFRKGLVNNGSVVFQKKKFCIDVYYKNKYICNLFYGESAYVKEAMLMAMYNTLEACNAEG